MNYDLTRKIGKGLEKISISNQKYDIRRVLIIFMFELQENMYKMHIWP
jgi:hypothetical protein